MGRSEGFVVSGGVVWKSGVKNGKDSKNGSSEWAISLDGTDLR